MSDVNPKDKTPEEGVEQKKIESKKSKKPLTKNQRLKRAQKRLNEMVQITVPPSAEGQDPIDYYFKVNGKGYTIAQFEDRPNTVKVPRYVADIYNESLIQKANARRNAARRRRVV